ncbi:stress response protein [Pseudoalteromonas phage J2-1_QLiu-2017]|nr:stress response protein [Pseudoalteromonas phage J2-1_QLiu-2017]
MNFSLSKTDQQNVFSFALEKKGMTDVKAKVCLVVDGSYSMDHLYANGTVSQLVNRALVVGDRFDDDGTINVFAFGSGKDYKQLKDATQEDFGNYKISCLKSGTEYAPVMGLVEDFFYKEKTTVKKEGGFLGFFAKKTEVVEAPEGRDDENDTYPVFVIFITDGASQYESSDISRLKALLGRRSDMFIQFVTLNCPYSTVIQKIKDLPNVGHADIKNIERVTDEELFDSFLDEKAKAVLA